MKETIIEKKRSAFRLNLREILEYRELLWTLTYRDLRVKYAQTVIGFLWVFLNPLFTLIILNFVFGTVAKVDTGEVPHLIYTIAGMCGWAYFQTVLGSAGGSIIGSQNMIKKIYFPRLVIPLQSVFHSDGTHIGLGWRHLDERTDDTLSRFPTYHTHALALGDVCHADSLPVKCRA